MVRRLLNFATHRIHNLPILVLMPHSRCNCRCVMCDIWKANQDKKELSELEIRKHIESFKRLGVREIVFSGGEALMHSNLWLLCQELKQLRIRLTLLTTGLLIERNAANIVANFDNVIISIDGSESVHDAIRNVPNGYSKIRDGIAALRGISPGYRITARSVIQRYNFHDLIQTVTGARALCVDQISFLPADVSSAAFNHADNLTPERVADIALNADETFIFETVVKRSFVELKDEYENKFIAESPQKMLRIVNYYRAVNGMGEFVAPACNAPWVSAVVESNGDVLPCFFQPKYGNIFDDDFANVLNSAGSVKFRKQLDVANDAVCRKCVCSLKVGITKMN